MPRFILDIAYNGTKYSGWQKQDDAITVQSVIEKSLSQLHQKEITIYGSGRTDAGVHALHQIAHFDVNELFEPEKKLTIRLNKMLPKDIHIWEIRKVHDDFHARFDAQSRTYEYVILTKFVPRLLDNSWFIPDNLNLKAIDECLNYLLGNHDFSSFCRKNEQMDHYRSIILESRLILNEDSLVFRIGAKRFLHHMVRSLVGDLIQVGKGNLKIEEFKRLLDEANREDLGIKAPASALTLVAVEY